MKLTSYPRRIVRPLVLALALTGAPLVAAASTAQAATPYCGITWGSQDKPLHPFTNPVGAPGAGVDAITNLRTGRHACFDRLVIDLGTRGGAHYSVRYVNAVVGQGQGATIPLRGGARLEIVLMAPAYDPNTGAQTYHFTNARELSNVAGYPTFRQVAYGGSFEGYTTIGLGVRARLPMRAFVVNGPGNSSHIVIDVARRW